MQQSLGITQKEKMSFNRNLTAYENQSSNHILAILICHLFTSGKFQLAHVIYDSKVLDGRLITAVNNECFGEISWITTDLTKFQPKEQNNKLNILQLIFANLNDPVWNVVFRNTSSPHYHLLMIPPKANNWIDIFESIEFLDSNTLIVVPHQKTPKIGFFTKIRNKPLNFIHEFDVNHPRRNLFNETFGKVESSWILGVHYSKSTICFGEKYRLRMQVILVQRYLTNFYSKHFENSFINGSSIACGNHSSSYSLGLPHSNSLYQELDFGAEFFGTNTRLVQQIGMNCEDYQKNFNHLNQ